MSDYERLHSAEYRDTDSPLCCCEYWNSAGERSHLLGLCCDCEAVDRAADRLFTGQSVQTGHVGEIMTIAEDRLRVPWRGGAKALPLGKVGPLLLVPSILWLASLHPLLLLLSLFLLPILFFCVMRIFFKHRPQTQFFLYWSYASAGVLQLENLCLVMLTCCSLLQYRTLCVQGEEARSSQGRLCRPCGARVVAKDHHCVWLGVCVSAANHRTFLWLLLLLLLSSLHLCLLLSSSACPGPLLGPLLLPKVCWPYTANSRLLLVGGLYSGLVGVLVLLLLGEQLTRGLRGGGRSREEQGEERE